MRPSLRHLLEGSIDYAGMFPPAKLPLNEALQEYACLKSGQEAWLVNRFVCRASDLQALCDASDSRLSVSVIGSGEDGARVDMAPIQHAADRGCEIGAYENRVPQGEGLDAAVASAKKIGKEFSGTDIYLEVGWGEGMVDAMHDAANLFEEVGFKARTGGTEAGAFPSAANLASFISECAALECKFKYTAGLHEPVRYFDETLGVHRHGFLNVMVAGVLAVTQDLNRRELEEILLIEDSSKFHFGVDDMRVGEHWIEPKHIDQFHEVFGGFGSCSVQEPLDGLNKHGWAQKVNS